jgi:hypothetical protein
MPGTLGRRLEHDPKSRAYAFTAPRGLTYGPVKHESNIGILDQDGVGACVFFSILDVLGSDPFFMTVPPGIFTFEYGVAGYSLATKLDPFPGWYDTKIGKVDTGTSGLAGGKAAVQLGLLSGYSHIFTWDDFMGALQKHRIIMGMGWMDTFDDPDPEGLVKITPTSIERGGHELCVDEWDPNRGRVGFTNHWRETWGLRGRFYMSEADTKEMLLNRQGDATVLVPVTAPAPVPDPDVLLWASTQDWRKGIVSRYTKAGKAVKALETWAKAKGFS